MTDYSKFYFDQIRSQVVNIKNQIPEDELSMSFLRLCCAIVLNLKYEDIDDDITDEPQDLGADAIHLEVDEEEKRLKIFIIQTRYNHIKCEKGLFDFNLEEEVVNKFKNIFDYFATEGTGMTVSEKVKFKKEEYESLLEDGYILDEIHFVACHLGRGLAKNSLETWIRWHENNPFKEKIKLTVFGLQEVFKKLEETRITNVDELVNLDGRYFELTTPDVKGLIGSIKATELIKLFEKYGNKLFQKNIRFSLGENIINRKIINSASEVQTRDKFWFLNNGITVVCNDYEKTGPQPENITLQVKSFQIVNGVQTTTSIDNAYRKTGNIDDVKVLIKIFRASDELAEMITESTNSQNPVNKRDLRSNEKIQKLIEEMLEGRGYYYQRKRNQWSEISCKEKIIDNYDFAQRYLAFYLERPMEAQKQKSVVFMDDHTYNEIFHSSLTYECLIFIHKSFRELLRQLRIIRRKVAKNELVVSKEVVNILPRAKIHLYYAFKIYLNKKQIKIGPDVPIEEEKALAEFSEKNTLTLLVILLDVIKKIYKDSPLEYVNVFKKRELAEKLKEEIEQNTKIGQPWF